MGKQVEKRREDDTAKLRARKDVALAEAELLGRQLAVHDTATDLAGWRHALNLVVNCGSAPPPPEAGGARAAGAWVEYAVARLGVRERRRGFDEAEAEAEAAAVVCLGGLRPV